MDLERVSGQVRAFDADQGVEAEPVGEGAGEVGWSVQYDQAAPDRAGQVQTSYPHAGHGRGLGADGEVHAVGWVVQAQVRLVLERPSHQERLPFVTSR